MKKVSRLDREWDILNSNNLFMILSLMYPIFLQI